MAALSPPEIAAVVERSLARRPWVRPLAAIADPRGLVAFVRDQLGDVVLRDDGWRAMAQPAGILVTHTPRRGALPQSALVSWVTIARHLRPDLSPTALGLSASGGDVQPGCSDRAGRERVVG
jgi:hypothetical protein